MKDITPERFRQLFLKVSRSPSGHIWSHGRCFEYAYIFMKVVGGTARSYLTHKKQYKAYGHCFVYFQGKFFDSESHYGKKNWKHLQDYMNKAQEKRVRKHTSINGMLKTWGVEKYKIDDCELLISKVLELHKTEPYPKEDEF